jgi:hypothetical protein
MRKAIAAWTLTAVAAATAAAQQAPPPPPAPGPTLASRSEVSQLGLGVILGDPIGGTAKFWFDQRFAADFGAGFASAEDRVAFWGDALYNDWRLQPQPPQGKLGAYFGAGPQLDTGDDPRFGVRTIVGLSFLPHDAPFEFFAEVGPLFRFTQGGHVDAVGGVGVRFQVPNGR